MKFKYKYLLQSVVLLCPFFLVFHIPWFKLHQISYLNSLYLCIYEGDEDVSRTKYGAVQG